MTAEERLRARRVYETHSALSAPRGRYPAYYLTRLEHPAMLELYRRWCRGNGILPGMPPSDEERAAFELSLFRPEVVAELLDYADWVAGQRARIGPELLDQHRRVATPLDGGKEWGKP